MKTYINVADVDAALGTDWTSPEKKERAVLIANVWLTNRKLPELSSIPEEWKLAGAEVARDAAKGLVYGSRETGVQTKSVSADTVSSSKTYREGAQTFTAGESLAMALLAPWLSGSGGGMSQFKLSRG